MAVAKTTISLSKITSSHGGTTNLVPSNSRDAFNNVLDSASKSSDLKNVKHTSLALRNSEANSFPVAMPHYDKDLSKAFSQVRNGFAASYTGRAVETRKSELLRVAGEVYSLEAKQLGIQEKPDNDFSVYTKLPNTNGFTLPFMGHLTKEVSPKGIILSIQGSSRMFGYVKKNNTFSYC